MTIDYLPLKRVTAMYADEIHEAVRRVVDSGWYLRGEAVSRFEQHYAQFIGTKHCVGVANGLDALSLMLRASICLGYLKEGDEIIVPANTFIATMLAITDNHLVPILVEPRPDTFQINDELVEQAITPRTRGLMLVHLYGKCAYTERVGDICQRHGLMLFEDNAQAHGCTFQGRRTGSLGRAAAHSFYPGKNLGALGDGGAVTTDDAALADTIRALANYGSKEKYVFEFVGRNSRLDEIQAAVLDVKLRYLERDNSRRRELARYYINKVDQPLIQMPTNDASCVWHIFPILTERRDALKAYLAEHGVETMIHYPIAPHKQQCYRQWRNLSLPVTERIAREVLSLPCHPALTDSELLYIIKQINAFTDSR